MQLPANAHVAIVDGETFKLVRNGGTSDAPKLSPVDAPAVDDEHRASGGRHNANVEKQGHSMEEVGHAMGVVEALNHMAKTNKIEALVVIADPKTLGELRKGYHGALEKLVVKEIAKTLGNSDAAQILKTIEAA